MRYVVELSDEAARNRTDAYDYYAVRSNAGAGRWYDAYLDTLTVLASDPQRYPRAREAEQLGIDLREAAFGTRPKRPTHRILFMIEESRGRILAVRHYAQRDWRSV